MDTFVGKNSIEFFYSKRAVILSFLLHLGLMFIHVKKTDDVKKEEPEALKVTLIETKSSAEIIRQMKAKEKRVPQPPIPPTQKVVENVKNKAEKKVEPKKTEIPPKVAKLGTDKIVPKSAKLGNPKQKLDQQVQKGDPMSTKKEAYKPGTEVAKAAKANIGSGVENKVAGANTDGGSGKVAGTKTVGDSYQGLSVADQQGLLNFTNNKKAGINGGGNGGGGVGHGQGLGVGNGIAGSGLGGVTGSPNGTTEVAKVATNVGSFTGSVNGKIDSSRGAEGLAQRGDIALAGGPTETVVMGNIDPDLLKSILRDHLPQFKYCYQKALDKNVQSSQIEGILKLKFTINREGAAEQINVQSQRELPDTVKGCVRDVLLGIQFPRPKGGGVVEVNQPIAFRPQKI